MPEDIEMRVPNAKKCQIKFFNDASVKTISCTIKSIRKEIVEHYIESNDCKDVAIARKQMAHQGYVYRKAINAVKESPWKWEVHWVNGDDWTLHCFLTDIPVGGGNKLFRCVDEKKTSTQTESPISEPNNGLTKIKFPRGTCKVTDNTKITIQREIINYISKEVNMPADTLHNLSFNYDYASVFITGFPWAVIVTYTTGSTSALVKVECLLSDLPTSTKQRLGDFDDDTINEGTKGICNNRNPSLISWDHVRKCAPVPIETLTRMFTPKEILFDYNGFVVARGNWTGEVNKVVACRWNDSELGYPNGYGKPQWMRLPVDTSVNQGGNLPTNVLTLTFRKELENITHGSFVLTARGWGVVTGIYYSHNLKVSSVIVRDREVRVESIFDVNNAKSMLAQWHTDTDCLWLDPNTGRYYISYNENGTRFSLHRLELISPLGIEGYWDRTTTDPLCYLCQLKNFILLGRYNKEMEVTDAMTGLTNNGTIEKISRGEKLLPHRFSDDLPATVPFIGDIFNPDWTYLTI